VILGGFADSDRAWGWWFLRERRGVDPLDADAVRGTYQDARNWEIVRGRWSREYRSLVDAIGCVFGGFPQDWPEPFPRSQRYLPLELWR
jgi:hypothetical protein